MKVNIKLLKRYKKKIKYCIVINNGYIKIIRHIIELNEDMNEIEEIKKYYYRDYKKLPGDEFIIISGYYNMRNFINNFEGAREGGTIPK